ncbi:MAG: hypothetical protein K8L97_05120 [Anaerolineae bacterium]|nr:hypothetical protein [Anaerolineae bacterium]
MPFPMIPAHGALGSWDEIIFLSVAAIFLIMMGISWIRSRTATFDESEEPTPETPAPESEADRFRLE